MQEGGLRRGRKEVWRRDRKKDMGGRWGKKNGEGKEAWEEGLNRKRDEW